MVVLVSVLLTMCQEDEVEDTLVDVRRCLDQLRCSRGGRYGVGDGGGEGPGLVLPYPF